MKKKEGIIRNSEARINPDRKTAIILLVPPLLFLSIFTLYPILRVVWMSLHSISITEPWSGEPFVGLKNYIEMLTDGRFWHSLKFTVLFSIITGIFELAIGLLLAVLASKKFKFRGLIIAAILFPWVLPTVTNALTWKWMFNFDYGLFNGILMQLNLIQDPINWLGNSTLAVIAIYIVSIWKTASFMALLLLPGLQTISKEIYEAAMIDGASKVQSFFRITLPMIRNVILVALVLRTLQSMQAYDLMVGLTNGGPGNATESLPLYIHNTAFVDMNMGYGSALGVVLFIVIAIITIIYAKFLYDPDG
ncbi:MAG TPA: sugar ABC transporter permease [Pseudogracilibacillus sp.]|nr:sugar ABC transporter permease [Pseudogracilibacillus sp.]